MVAPGATSIPEVRLAAGESVISVSLAGETLTGEQAKEFASSPIPRTATVFIASHTGQRVKRAAVGAEGWVLDPFSRDAVATHLRAVGEPLLRGLPAAPYAVFSDSLEAYGADWTPALTEEFARRRGYDLLPHLPALGAGGTAEAENVRHDWGKTLTELVDENYLMQINAWALAHHTQFRSQTYGDPAVSFSSQRLVGLAEGEHPFWRSFSTLRWASSANHVFHRNVTSAEAFTWLHSPVFRATPLDMKAEADLHFLIGVNQIIGHGWPYSPPQAGEPGWSLYAAAVFNDHNPWHPVMADVTRYLARISYLLRQGEPANQVAVLLPTDDAWARFRPGKVSVTAEMDQLVAPSLMSAILSAGYNVDFVDADAVEANGIRYPLLVLPPMDRLPRKTREAIDRYVAGGGKAIAVGRAPSLDENGNRLEPAASLVVTEEEELPAVLTGAAPPDFALDGANEEIGFVRRKLPNSDVYFVANTANHPVAARARFATTHKFGERWDVESGAAVALVEPTVSLELAPYESAVFVFRDTPWPAVAEAEAGEPLLDLSEGWKVDFESTGRTAMTDVPADWSRDAETRFYSGAVTYSRSFGLRAVPAGAVFVAVEGGTPIKKPEEPDRPGMRAWFDPPVREAAVVFVNGRRLGALWHPPYRLEVTGFLKPGENQMKIEVFNTAMNAWAAQPPRDYQPLIARYGDRFQMQDMDRVQVVPSGLMGRVKLLGAKAGQ
jgi:hypothetical protein